MKSLFLCNCNWQSVLFWTLSPWPHPSSPQCLTMCPTHTQTAFLGLLVAPLHFSLSPKKLICELFLSGREHSKASPSACWASTLSSSDITSFKAALKLAILLTQSPRQVGLQVWISDHAWLPAVLGPTFPTVFIWDSVFLLVHFLEREKGHILGSKICNPKPGIVGTVILITWEPETGGAGVRGQRGLFSANMFFKKMVECSDIWLLENQSSVC